MKMNNQTLESENEINPAEVAESAYFRWERRGRPHGTHDEDWFSAENELGRKQLPAQDEWAVPQRQAAGAISRAARGNAKS